MDVAELIVRVLVGGLLVGAGVTKLMAGHAATLRVVEAYDILRGRTAVAWARVLPPLEVLVGSLLVMGLWSRPAAMIAVALLAVMTAAVASVLVRRKKASCGCFAKSQQVSWRIVGRNAALITGVAAVAFEGGGQLSLDAVPWIRVETEIAIALGVVVAAVLSAGRNRVQEGIN